MRLHQAGCNGCIGMGQAPAKGKLSLRTVPRNFPGRSGTKEDAVFLCSPETATASALLGRIADPRELQDEPGMSYPLDVSSLSDTPETERFVVQVAPNTGALPVELAGFDAQRSGDYAITVQWETLSETNNAGFEVQHAAPEGDFEAQGFVEGQGTTDTPQQYAFDTDELAPGTHQFRLKQTDFDGTSELTEARTVEVALEESVVLNTAPNPVRDNGTVQFAVQQAEPVTVSVYNMLGQRVETLYEGTPTPDQVQTVSLDTSTLSSGTYFVRIEGASLQKTRRIAVIR